MAELCEVVITAPDPDPGWLKDFSRKLVEQRLCASAHNFAPVQSVYRWLGDIYERTKGRVSLHTRRDRVAEIVALVRKEHPYEVPGVSTRTIAGGNPDYLAWIAPGNRTGVALRGLGDPACVTALLRYCLAPLGGGTSAPLELRDP